MNANNMNFEQLFVESMFGLCVMAMVAVLNIYSFAWITITYRQTLNQSAFYGRHYEMLRFVAFTMLLVVAMLLSLSVWVLALTSFGFISDWLAALLLTASYFTTVGNFAAHLPFGWRLIPSLIAFSGLFSFAWATGSSMSMAANLAAHLEKHKQI
jgi:uncharacterized membrane protein